MLNTLNHNETNLKKEFQQAKQKVKQVFRELHDMIESQENSLISQIDQQFQKQAEVNTLRRQEVKHFKQELNQLLD